MRIRTIKPEFWTDEGLSELNPEAALLAIGLLNYADDEGYFKANPKLVEAAIFPLRDLSVSIHGALSELLTIGYIQVTEGSDGKKYGRVVKFSDHQRINRPTDSKIKPLCVFTEDSVNTHTQVNEPSLPEVEGKGSGKGSGSGKDLSVELADANIDPPASEPSKVTKLELPKSQPCAEIEAVVEHYKIMHPRARPGPKERKAIKARLAEGYDVGTLKAAIDGMHQTPHNLGQNERGQKYLGLELCMRTGDQVLRFAETANQQPEPCMNERERRGVAASQRWLERMEAMDAVGCVQ